MKLDSSAIRNFNNFTENSKDNKMFDSKGFDQLSNIEKEVKGGNEEGTAEGNLEFLSIKSVPRKGVKKTAKPRP